MQMLDFNAIQQPTWQVKLRDEAQTVVTLSAPTTELVDRLMAAQSEFGKITKTKDGRAINAIYDLMADLLNCNEDGYEFTGEEVRNRYKMRLLDVFQFAAGYLEFIKEMNDAKN